MPQNQMLAMPAMAMAGPTAPTAPMMMGSMQQPVYVTSQAQLPAGVVPYSHAMMQQALGQGAYGGQAVQQPEAAGTILTSVLKTAVLGAGAGAVFGLLPFPPGFIGGALIGGIGGAVLGLVKGVAKVKRQQNEFHTMQAHALHQQQLYMQQQQALRPQVAAPTAPAVAGPGAAVRPVRRRRPAAARQAPQRVQARRTQRG